MRTFTAAAVLDLIAALVDKSLVVVDSEVLGQARYRLLESIREYAAARLEEAGETKVFQLRLRDYTVGVAERNLAVGPGLDRGSLVGAGGRVPPV